MTTRFLPRPGLLAGAALALCAAAGCGGDGRGHLSGRVTYAGQPVKAGVIFFEPDGGRGNRGPGGVAPIQDGRYATDPGMGTVGGPHVVRVKAGDGSTDSPFLNYGRPLFDGEYRTTADLPRGAATYDIDIPAR